MAGDLPGTTVGCLGCLPYLAASFCSRSAFKLMAPAASFIFFSHDLYPGFCTEIVCSPGASSNTDGVLPMNSPSISISALSGVEATESLEMADGSFVPAWLLLFAASCLVFHVL